MHRKLNCLIGLLIVLGWCGLAGAQETLRYSGSATILKAIMYSAAKDFEKLEGIKFDLKGESTEFGLKKLLAGEIRHRRGRKPVENG